MNLSQRHGAKSKQDPQTEPRSPFAEVAGRFAHWFTGLERGEAEDEANPPAEADPDPFRSLTAGVAEHPEPSRFPVVPLGYSRAAVDEHLAELEHELTELGRELAELRSEQDAPMSVTEELERIGEQTAQILVVAHDKASETTRRAEEQAERCIADAAANAVALTEGAKQRLQELDAETDSVWRERERLLEDVRAVSAALASLADQASERFPAADQPPSGSAWGAAGTATVPRPGPARFAAQDTVAFSAEDVAQAHGEDRHRGSADVYGRGEGDHDDGTSAPSQDPGDTASWLAGFEPPPPDPPYQP